MALTNQNNNNNANPTRAEPAANLLNFVTVASSNIHEALASKKKRNVNVRKFIHNRVKRLNNKGTGKSQTKTKSALKVSAKSSVAPLQHRSSWSQLSTQDGVSQPVQTIAMSTVSYTTSPLPSTNAILAESSLYATQTVADSKQMDSELESLLSEFGLDSSFPSTRYSSGSYSPGSTSRSSLESQVCLGEHPYSPPYSECSDELFEDSSAYSSPISSQNNVCSPPVSSIDWPVPSPQNTRCPVTSMCDYSQQHSVPSYGCGWMTPYISTFNQVPPMTPTVSELLMNTPTYF